MKRLWQCVQVAWYTWRMHEENVLVIAYTDEPAIIFSDRISYQEINDFMKAIYAEDTSFARK